MRNFVKSLTMNENIKAKIIIAAPPTGLYRRDDRCQSKVDDQTVRVIFPPVDLAVFGVIARDCGVEPIIKDYPAEGGSFDDFRADLKNLQPTYLMIPVTTATIGGDLETIRLAKEIVSKIVTLAKGEYLNIFGDSVLAEHPELDLILSGETEETFREILMGANPEKTAGIICRTKQGIRRNRPRPFLKNLDELPLPDRSLLKNELYRSPENGEMITVINAARGCPSECIFCSARRVSGARIRLRSPNSILLELKECVETYGITNFLFNGDTFTFKKSWLIALCKSIVEEGLDIRWGCNSRVDTIDPERLEWMKKAGCWVVAFGVESGSQKILDFVKKNITLSQVRRAIAMTKKAGIRTHAFFVIGTPPETKETLKETYKFARRLNTDFFDFNIAYPLPGTELYDIVTGEDLFVREAFGEGSYADAMIRTRTLSPEDLTKWRKRALLRLYLRPLYILRILWRAGSLKVMGYYFRAAFARLKGLLKNA